MSERDKLRLCLKENKDFKKCKKNKLLSILKLKLLRIWITYIKSYELFLRKYNYRDF